jgi:hypothetical protein
MEQTGDGINQYREGRLPQLTTRLAPRQTPFDPTIACLTRRTMGACAPQDPKTQRPLSPIGGGVHRRRAQKYPPRRPLPHQPSGETTGVIRTLLILLAPLAKAGLPRPPLPAAGRRLGHLTPSLPFLQRPRHTGRQCRRAFRGQSTRRAHQMCPTGWTLLDPVWRDPIPIAHQDTGPILKQCSTGFLRAPGMEQGQRHGVRDHRPQPLQGVV